MYITFSNNTNLYLYNHNCASTKVNIKELKNDVVNFSNTKFKHQKASNKIFTKIINFGTNFSNEKLSNEEIEKLLNEKFGYKSKLIYANYRNANENVKKHFRNFFDIAIEKNLDGDDVQWLIAKSICTNGQFSESAIKLLTEAIKQEIFDTITHKQIATHFMYEKNIDDKKIKNIIYLIKMGFDIETSDKITSSLKYRRNKNIQPQKKHTVIEKELKKLKKNITPKILEDYELLTHITTNLLYAQHLALINNLTKEEISFNYGKKLKKSLATFLENLSSVNKEFLFSNNINILELQNKLLSVPITKTHKQKTKSKTKLSNTEKKLIQKYNIPQKIWLDNSLLEKYFLTIYEQIISKKYEVKTFDNLDNRLITEKRDKILFDWKDFIEAENLSASDKLIVASALTKNLLPNNKEIPFYPSISIVGNILSAYKNNQNLDKFLNQQITNDKIYRNVNIDGIKGKWIKIPAYYNDIENFVQNVNKLKALSLHNWCTHTTEAEPLLHKGDFYILTVDGKTQLGVRTQSGEIQEIQGYRNDRHIPVAYIDILKDFLKVGNFELNTETKADIERDEVYLEEFKNVKYDINKLLAEGKYKQIFERLGIRVKENEQGKFIIDEFALRTNNYRMLDLGIDEKKLFENVIEIQRKIDYEKTNIKDISNIEIYNLKTIPWDKLD